MKKCTYWLIVVGGTSSINYRERLNSHVNKFYKKFELQGGNQKAILDGPKNHRLEGIKNGNTGEAILRDASAFVGIFEKRSKSKITVNKSGDSFINGHPLRICFVGYSRGATICMDASYDLFKKRKIKTHFLGLLDPVKRDPNLRGEIILEGITRLHIARRKPGFSRTWFGYAGRTFSLPNSSFLSVAINESLPLILPESRGELYDTSHGGMGGAEEYIPMSRFDKNINPNHDGTCSPTLRTVRLEGNDKFLVTRWGKQYYSEEYQIIANPKEKICRTESQRVYDDLVVAAKKAGLF